MIVDLPALPSPPFYPSKKARICANLRDRPLRGSGSGSLNPPPAAAPAYKVISIFCCYFFQDRLVSCVICVTLFVTFKLKKKDSVKPLNFFSFFVFLKTTKLSF